MNIKQLILTTSGLLLAGIVEAQSAHPNVILIYTDDHGSLDVNCFGAKDLCTPHMDALANQGVRFTQFYGAAVSSVSRASLLTGQFAKRAGLTVNAGGNSFLPVEKETIAERMKSNGYRTALIGKWHLGDRIEQGPNAQGFDYFWGIRGGCVDNYSHFYYWGGPNRHDLWQNEREIYSPGNFFAAENLKEIKKFATEDKEKPFFIYWAVNIPHYPLQPSEKWLDYYADLPNPRRMYAAFVSTFDDYLGELRTFLAAEGLADNTILIFQSDNGHSMEERTFRGGGYSGPYRAGKFSLFEGGIRVPAIIRLPRHGASCPIGLGVSCSADRNIKCKINKDGIWIEKMDDKPGELIPAELREAGEGDVVKIDLNQPMADILKELTKYPVATRLSLNGTIIVGRDIAHAKLKERLDRGEDLPQYIKDHPIYYAGPAKTPEGMACGSMGPTTAGRMDPYVDLFQSHGGSMIMLAKGNRSQQVTDACKKYGGFYLGSIGGPAAILAQNNIKSIECVEYPELGMEAIWKIEVEDFPAFILVDDKGNDFFKQLKPRCLGNCK